MKTQDAIFITTVLVGEEELTVYRDKQSGAIFGIDSSFIVQCFGEDDEILIPSPFNKGVNLKLIE